MMVAADAGMLGAVLNCRSRTTDPDWPGRGDLPVEPHLVNHPAAVMNGCMSGTLDLPPPFTAVVLREHRDAMAHARNIAATAGAGTLVWARRYDSVEVAVVLEPEEPLIGARRAHYAVMNALGDALATHLPPEKPIAFGWPDTILVDGGIVGGARLEWPDGATDLEPPDWLVAGFMVRLAVAHTRPAGRDSHPLDIRMLRGTSLEIEGFELMDGGAIVSSFARHLMAGIDLWQEQGFTPVAEQFLARMANERSVRRGIDNNGDLLLRRIGSGAHLERQAFLAALMAAQWMDPESGEPWL